MPRVPLEAGVSAKREQAKSDELPTELCFGTDGCIYVNAEGLDPEKLASRKMFHGYAMTAEEAKVAVKEIHRLAFNVTVSVQEVMRQRRARKKRR